MQSLVEQGQKGELTMQPGKSMMESLESSINKVLYPVPSYRGGGHSIWNSPDKPVQNGSVPTPLSFIFQLKVLNTARDESGTSAQVSLNERNAVKAMADAGSKGSFINISQVRGCLRCNRCHLWKAWNPRNGCM